VDGEAEKLVGWVIVRTGILQYKSQKGLPQRAKGIFTKDKKPLRLFAKKLALFPVKKISPEDLIQIIKHVAHCSIRN
jgi:hypothetical protein